MAEVDLERIEKRFPDGTRALEELTIRVADGELLVVVGPSGCGKSTVLRVLAGLESPTSGVVRIGGRVVNDLSPQERNIAMVFQDYALYPHRTVRGNLEFPLLMRRMPREEIRAKVEHAAELLELGPLMDRLPKQLSGGQRQRVAMGRALVREPTVFLLDEPLSNLDARLRGEVRTEIGELQRRTGTTMLYVTHDQGEAMTLGHRVAVLSKGKLQQLAPPRELYERPANAFVAGFIGSPPMNLFSARVVEGGDGRPGLAVGEAIVAPVPGGFASSAAVRTGTALTVGVRPESLVIAEEGEEAFPATVEVVEFHGHETLIEAKLGGASGSDSPRLRARLPGTRLPAPGEVLRLRAVGEQIQLFDESGVALSRTSSRV